MASASPSGRTRALTSSVGVGLLVCLLIAGLVDLTGIGASVDDRVAGVWFALRGERASTHRAVLVAADRETIDAWGPPPWGAERQSALLGRMDGRATLVVEAEPGRLFMAGEPLPQPPLSAAGVVAIRPERVGQSQDALVPVNYVGEPDRIPTVAAHRVASGTIQSSFFDGRVVVLGLTDPRYARQWPTPVGWATPGHVATHALAGRVDGVPLDPIPWWMRVLLGAIAAGAALLFGGRGSKRRWGVPLGVMVIALLLDLALFGNGRVRLGVAAPMSAAFVALVINVGARLRELRLALASIRQVTAGRRRAQPAGSSADKRWVRLAETLRAATDAHWSAVLALSGRQPMLEVMGVAGIDEKVLIDWPRDRRKPPFATAFARGRGVEVATLADDDGERVMVLPLRFDGGWVGAWVVAVDRDGGVTLDARVLERLQAMLGRLVGRARAPASRVVDDIGETTAAVRMLARQSGQLDQTVEQMGPGVLIADPWGGIRHINAAMRGRLNERTGEAAERLIRRGAAEVLAALAGWTASRARAQLALIFAERDDLQLTGELRLQRIEVFDETGGGVVETVVLLTYGKGGGASEGLSEVDGDRVRVDVRPLLLRSGRVAAAESRMRIEYEFSDPLPRAECDERALAQAIDALFTEIRRNSEAGSVTTVSVAREEDTVGILWMNTSYTVPRGALTALFSIEAHAHDGGTERMHIARRAVHQAGGRLDATSDPISGVVFHLALPAADTDGER